MDLDLVARLGAITNLTHGFIYFSPTAAAAYEELGLEGRQQYFGSRGAALGPVPAEVIIATFFNFNPDIVRRAIPSAWEVAEPTAIQEVRMAAAGRQLGALDALDAPALAEATELAARMADGVSFEARPLAGANHAVDLPDEPWARLWQHLTVIREWRGDAHVAVLAAAPVTAREALVLHAATGQVPASALLATRQWSEEQWAETLDDLVGRGLVEPDGNSTDGGRTFREGIEHATNVASAPLVDAIGPDDTRRLIELLKPVRTALMASDAFAALIGVRD